MEQSEEAAYDSAYRKDHGDLQNQGEKIQH
jgi:hypothetical protein